MNYRIEINYLKNKLKYDDLTDYQIYNIKEEIKGFEKLEQKQTLKNKVERKYKNMVKDNDGVIDKGKEFFISSLNLKSNKELLESLLLGKFGNSVRDELEIHIKTLKDFTSKLEEFQKSIIYL